MQGYVLTKKDGSPLTLAEAVEFCKADNQACQHATANDNAVGRWVEKLGRYVPVMMLDIQKHWHIVTYELFVNGKPTYKDEDWTVA